MESNTKSALKTIRGCYSATKSVLVFGFELTQNSIKIREKKEEKASYSPSEVDNVLKTKNRTACDKVLPHCTKLTLKRTPCSVQCLQQSHSKTWTRLIHKVCSRFAPNKKWIHSKRGLTSVGSL